MNLTQEKARRRRTRNLTEEIRMARREVSRREQQLDTALLALELAREHLMSLEALKAT